MSGLIVKVSDSLDNVPNENVVTHLGTDRPTDQLTDQLLELLEWLFATKKSIREIEEIYEKNDNKFIKTFIAVLVNSPFKETDVLEGRSIPLKKYLQYGSILQGAFNYISKNHRVRTKGTNCKCCVCSSGQRILNLSSSKMFAVTRLSRQRRRIMKK